MPENPNSSVVSRTAVEVFVELVRRYCDLIENPPEELAERLRSVAVLLAELYAASLDLPDTEMESSNHIAEVAISRPRWPGFGELDAYWEVFDPYKHEEPVGASLTDDVLDVYCDLQRGLTIYAGPRSTAVADAVWEWRFLRDNHWGDHAVDALRALQRARQRVSG